MLMVDIPNICSLKPGTEAMYHNSCAGFEVRLCHVLCICELLLCPEPQFPYLEIYRRKFLLQRQM